jgi:hypothetical protein
MPAKSTTELERFLLFRREKDMQKEGGKRERERVRMLKVE